MRKNNIFITMVLVLILLVQGGCEKDLEGGRLVLRITDAPFPQEWIAEVNITVTGVDVRTDNTDSSSPYLRLSNDTLTFNLADLRNGVTETLVDKEIGPGRIDLVRLYIGDANIVLTNGDLFDLKVPSGAQTGLKLFIKPAIMVEGGITADLVLDFDLEKSLVPNGNIATIEGVKGFNFKPVVRVVNLSTSGRAEGKVTDPDINPVENASVWIEADTVLSSTLSDAYGYYNIIGIPTGIYKIYCTAQDYDTVSSDIVIIEANRTTRNFTLTPLN